MASEAALGGAEVPDGEREALELLERGTLEVAGRLVDASNATLFCTISGGGAEAACVYKPVAGERPLWDFPNGTLAGREVAAYVVSRAAGWNIVPPTVMRDGPFGPGMCQLWIDLDEQVDLVALARSEDHAGLREMAVFDAVINNADRKIGHLLPVTDGHLYGCDHGVSFSEDYKLRTVLWQWRGRPLTTPSVDVLRRLAGGLGSPVPGRSRGWLADELADYLTPAEIAATSARVSTLLKHKVHPSPPDDWPAIPWPPVLYVTHAGRERRPRCPVVVPAGRLLVVRHATVLCTTPSGPTEPAGVNIDRKWASISWLVAATSPHRQVSAGNASSCSRPSFPRQASGVNTSSR